MAARYITAEDVGIDVNDMEYVYRETEYGDRRAPGPRRFGRSPPFTAYGACRARMATLNQKFGDEEVGSILRRAGPGPRRHGVREAAEGTRRQDLRHRHQPGPGRQGGVRNTAPRRWAWTTSTTCRRRSPCALGGTVNEQTLPRLKAMICGAANNQLANNAIGDEATKRGILYAPDYAVNAGGVMNVALELDGYNRERAMRMTHDLPQPARIFEISGRDNIPTMAADRMAEGAHGRDRQAQRCRCRTAPRSWAHPRALRHRNARMDAQRSQTGPGHEAADPAAGLAAAPVTQGAGVCRIAHPDGPCPVLVSIPEG